MLGGARLEHTASMSSTPPRPRKPLSGPVPGYNTPSTMGTPAHFSGWALGPELSLGTALLSLRQEGRTRVEALVEGAATWVAAVQKKVEESAKRVKTKIRTCDTNTRKAIAITTRLKAPKSWDLSVARHQGSSSLSYSPTGDPAANPARAAL